MRFMTVHRAVAPVLFGLMALFAFLVPAPAAQAADYLLGPEDVIAVSVWLHPELERSVTVSADGNITLPPVGEIKAAGLSTKQLGERIADRLSAYLRQTTTVTVTVVTYMSRSVYVTGSVANPGRFGFERIPSIVEVLGSAGGALTGANLEAVQIVRTENGLRRTLLADVASAMRDGDTSRLPELKAGDTVIISGVVQGTSAGGEVSVGSGAAVLGEVTNPGLVSVGAGVDIWAVLAAAGGTTERADLRSVRVLTRTETGTTVAAHDLRAVLDNGSRAPVTIKTGDVVFVLTRRPSPWNNVAALLSLSRDLINVIVLIEYFNN